MLDEEQLYVLEFKAMRRFPEACESEDFIKRFWVFFLHMKKIIDSFLYRFYSSEGPRADLGIGSLRASVSTTDV